MGVADENGFILSRTKSVSVRGDNTFITTPQGRYLANSDEDKPEITSIEGTSFGNQLLMTTGRFVYNGDNKRIGALFANYLLDDSYAQRFKERFLRESTEVIFYTKEGGVYGNSIKDQQFKKIVLSYFNPESEWIKNGKSDAEIRYGFSKFYIVKNIVFSGLENSPGGVLVLVPSYRMMIYAQILLSVIFVLILIKFAKNNKLFNKKGFKIKIALYIVASSAILSLTTIIISSNVDYSLLKNVPYPLYNSTIRLDPESGVFSKNFERTISANINTGDEYVNLATLEIKYDTDAFVVEDIITDNSFCTMIIEKNIDIENGIINYTCGIESPGYNGKNGNIVSFIVRPTSVGSHTFKFTENTKIFANDGLGTNVLRYANDASYSIEEGDTQVSVIFSYTHPNSERWYKSNDVKINWQKTPNTKYYYSVDQNTNSVPNGDYSTDSNRVSINIPESGIYYFHLKESSDLKNENINHYKLMIDSNPPSKLIIKSSSKEAYVGDVIRLKFEAEDNESGLQGLYYVSIGNDLYLPVGSETYVPLSYPGTQKISVRAYDKAGNFTEKSIDIKVKAKNIADYIGATIIKSLEY